MTPRTVTIRNYYVSNAGTGSGLGVSSPMSVDDFEANISTLAPWANIHLNKGETFEIVITGLKSGQTLKAFGSGDAPIIIGSNDISANDWMDDGNNIFYATLEQTPKTIFINGTEARKAETDWIAITARPSTSQVTASSTTLNALNTVESLVGAEFTGRLLGWHPSKTDIVTGYNAGVLSFASKIGTETTNSASPFPNAGLGFKLRNKKSFISEVNDWSYDASTQRLYVKTNGVAPQNIRACFRDYGVQLSEDVIDVTIDGIEFTQQYLEGAKSVNNDGLTIQNCNFHDIHMNAISARGDSENVSILNNTIDTISGNGLDIGALSNSIISRNTISNIGVQDWFCPEEYSYAFNFTKSPSNQILTLGLGIGIQVGYDALSDKGVPKTLEISYNDISETGYLGVGFVGKSVTVKKNTVSIGMNKWSDGGGIYCINRPFSPSHDTRDCLIQNNIVRNIIGSSDAKEGTGDNNYLMAGIYIDNGTTNTTVDNNTVETTRNMCLLVNMDTRDNVFTNNTFIGATDDQVVMFRELQSFLGFQGVNSMYKKAIGNTFNGNICVTRLATVQPVAAKSFDSSVNATYTPFEEGEADNNHYVNPYSTTIGLHNSTDCDLAAWKTAVGADANSTEYSNFLTYVNEATALNDIKIEINDTDAAVEFNIPAGYTDAYGDAPANPYIIAPYSSLIYLKVP